MLNIIIKIQVIVLLTILTINFGLDTYIFVKDQADLHNAMSRYEQMRDERHIDDTLPDVKLER
jgi:hypothetical protein